MKINNYLTPKNNIKLGHIKSLKRVEHQGQSVKPPKSSIKLNLVMVLTINSQLKKYLKQKLLSFK